jgi:L-histidine N-alpha-methyltransferase
MKEIKKHPVVLERTNELSAKFRADVLEGLSKKQKALPSKYFYDAAGDTLFQELMGSVEYYPTRCELEIFVNKADAFANVITGAGSALDLIELGSGDGTKTIHLLKKMVGLKLDFNYLPIDISGNILSELEQFINSKLPAVNLVKIQGEYLEALQRATLNSTRRKVVLFLGANIGNLTVDEAKTFCKQVRTMLAPGDLFIIGFDLKKDPRIIHNAYDDAQGLTRAFNLNLLYRINRELGADFNTDMFDHYCSYDPESGACKSYLVSLADQEVDLGAAVIRFTEGESIWMEISQKYTHDMISQMAYESGFLPVTEFMDNKGWFSDACWKAV